MRRAAGGAVGKQTLICASGRPLARPGRGKSPPDNVVVQLVAIANVGRDRRGGPLHGSTERGLDAEQAIILGARPHPALIVVVTRHRLSMPRPQANSETERRRAQPANAGSVVTA